MDDSSLSYKERRRLKRASYLAWQKRIASGEQAVIDAKKEKLQQAQEDRRVLKFRSKIFRENPLANDIKYDGQRFSTGGKRRQWTRNQQKAFKERQKALVIPEPEPEPVITVAGYVPPFTSEKVVQKKPPIDPAVVEKARLEKLEADLRMSFPQPGESNSDYRQRIGRMDQEKLASDKEQYYKSLEAKLRRLSPLPGESRSDYRKRVSKIDPDELARGIEQYRKMKSVKSLETV